MSVALSTTEQFEPSFAKQTKELKPKKTKSDPLPKIEDKPKDDSKSKDDDTTKEQSSQMMIRISQMIKAHLKRMMMPKEMMPHLHKLTTLQHH
jgi:hypothetical protein